MIIYIMRHGQAEAPITADEVRRLTPKGVLDTQSVVSARLDALKNISALWVSPLVRAQQTAQIALTCLSGIAEQLPLQSSLQTTGLQSTALQTTSLLVPEADPRQVIEWLYGLQLPDEAAVLLVSHQPLVSRLLGLLCGKSEGFYPMGTSSLAAVRIQPVAAGLGELLWLDHAAY